MNKIIITEEYLGETLFIGTAKQVEEWKLC